jgi:hypothetical protein
MAGYPVQTFSSFAQLLAYINSEWITNGQGDITGVVGNNVVNALLTFIEESPVNSTPAPIWSAGGTYVATVPIVIFTGTAPTTLQWTNNIYNEYLFINTINQSIPLANGFVYYDINLNTVDAIPPLERVRIILANNNQWIQASDLGNVIPPANSYYGRLDFVVGNTGSPLTTGQTVLTINQTNIAANSVNVTSSGAQLYIGRTNEFSYTIVYSTANIIITFNQPVSLDQDISVTYAYSL